MIKRTKVRFLDTPSKDSLSRGSDHPNMEMINPPQAGSAIICVANLPETWG